MTTDKYNELKELIKKAGYENEIKFINELLDKPCNDPEMFKWEAIYVIINSGMKQQIAQQIYNKIITAVETDCPIDEVFFHKGKVKAISYILKEYKLLFEEYGLVADKVEWLEKNLPFIGKITKYHLARNLGVDCCKPDRHLVRIAASENTGPAELCKQLSKETGDRVGAVDVVLWRAANLGFI